MTPTPDDALRLHSDAQKAEKAGHYQLAAWLYRQAAEVALTPNGRVVLEEKARDALARTNGGARR